MGGRELALVPRRVVVFRPAAGAVARAARRPPGFAPGVLIELDERRISRRRARPSSKVKWFVIGSGAALLPFFVKMIVP